MDYSNPYDATSDSLTGGGGGGGGGANQIACATGADRLCLDVARENTRRWAAMLGVRLKCVNCGRIFVEEANLGTWRCKQSDGSTELRSIAADHMSQTAQVREPSLSVHAAGAREGGGGGGGDGDVTLRFMWRPADSVLITRFVETSSFPAGRHTSAVRPVTPNDPERRRCILRYDADAMRAESLAVACDQ
jgi:hypothetical protein